MRGLGFMAVACAATMTTAAQAAPADTLGGVYSSVRYIEEAGDVLGMEVDLRPGPSPAIVVTDCEGGCSGGKVWPVKIDGRTIRFTICEEGVEMPSHKKSCPPMTFVGRFRADGALVLTMPGNSDVHEVLRRVRHPRPHQVEQDGCGKDQCPG